MAEAVNPYRLWLQLDTDASSVDHYQLLELAPFEQDLDKIHHAADRASARVRSHRPGPHAAAWARLLDEIAHAKTCLTDPGKKAAYDGRLRASQATAHRSPDEPGQPEIAAVNQLPDLFPPGMEPDSPLAPATASPAKTAGATPTDSGTSARSATADAETASAPASSPTAAGAPHATPPTRKPPPPPDQSPVVSRAGRLLDDPYEDSLGDRTGYGQLNAATPVNAHVAPAEKEKPSIVPLVVAVVAIVIIVTLIVAFLAMQRGMLDAPSGPPAPTQPSPSPSTQPGIPSKPSGDPRADRTPDNRAGTESSRHSEANTDQHRDMGWFQDANGADNDQRSATSPSVDTDASSSQQPTQPNENAGTDDNSTSPSQAAGKSVPTAGTSTVRLSAEQLSRLSRTLTAIQLALANHDFDLAQAELKNATSLAANTKYEGMVQRLGRLARLTEDFWETVESTIKRLRGAEELSVGSEGLIVLVVETGPDSITVRKEGRNLRYSLDDMPPGLALALAKLQLKLTNPDDLLQLGACLATQSERKPVYLEEARRYWEQAAALGADTLELMLTLSDSYQLAE